ncbi:DUF6801 domain-containing protein [Spirillospora sp. CA-294931]|uniref:DUF6801 domain-containing protein n=1 Tax=Spirillospora sp. CA-294931 TaxID=3240042 RepID=UPI003D943B2F
MRIRARGALGKGTAIGLGAVVAGALAGGGSSASAENADATLAYTCKLPSGAAQKVGVRVKGAFPESGTVGKPIQPGRITTTVTLGKGAVAELEGLAGGPVVGTASLATTATQNGRSTPIPWSGLATPATPVPEGADLELAASGDVPSVAPGAAGDLTFAAGDLALSLVQQKTTKDAAAPAKAELTCSPAKGQALTLATVPVTGGNGTAPPPGAAAPKPGPAAAPAQAKTPPECGKYRPPGEWINYGCTYMSGFSNVKKLNGASILNDPEFEKPALTNIAYRFSEDGINLHVQLKFVSPLRSKANFLTFGFMPTRSMMELTQMPLGPGKDYGTFVALDDGSGIQKVTAHMKMSIRLFDVAVNGSPLNVGKRCQSKVPADIKLTGEMPSVLEAGRLEGVLEIPAFKGCGVGEDLDPIFNRSVSGPGNTLRVSLGASCMPDDDINCPPVLPKPERQPPPKP